MMIVSRKRKAAGLFGIRTRVLGLFLVLLASLFAGQGHGAGGDVLWTHQPAVAGKQEARASAVDSVGNLILAGYSETTGSDYYTVKVLADGSGLAWPAKIFDKAGAQDLATATAVDGNDDIIVTGYVHNGSNYDIHTIKYAGVDGSVLWQHTYNGAAGGNDFAGAIAVDSLNNIYVGGTMQGANAKDDFVIIKYVPSGPNPDGTPTWVATYDGAAGNHDRLTAIAAGPDGLAVTGESQNVADFDLVTIKYGYDGSKLWERRYNDSGDGKGQAVALDNAGNVVVTGYVHNGLNRDGFTVKYAAADGTPLWAKMRDGGYDDEGRALWLDAAGNVYVTGYGFTLATNRDLWVGRYAAADGADSLPGGWQVLHNTLNGNHDVGVAVRGDNAGDLFVTSVTSDHLSGFDDSHTYKFSRSNGTLLWSAVHGTATRHDRPVGLGLTPEGDPLMAGWSDTAATGYDFVAVKYDAGALDAPTGLTATVVSTSEIALSWTDNAANEENFVVERKSGAGDWTLVTAALAADSTSYNDTGLTADTRYYYRVKATNTADGSSPWSNEVGARTTVVSYDPPAWLHVYAGSAGGDDEPAAIAVGPDNHPVVTGFSFDTEGGFDYCTLKLDRADAAAVTWSARYNDDDNEVDFATALAVDGANRAIVSGYASLYGGGAGNSNDIYTIGYSAAGAQLWADQYNGPAGNDDRSTAVASAVDGSNNVAVVGYGKNAGLNDDIYLLKYNAAGVRQWAATPYDGGGLDQPAAVAFAANGDLFVAGKTWRNGAFDYFVARYSGATGALLWGGSPRFYNGAGNGNDYATSLAVDGAGNLYVTGYSTGASGHGDIVTLRYDGATGNVMAGWPKAYDGGGYDHGVAVVIDPHNDDAIVAGTSFVGPGNHDIVLLRYAADGALVWSSDLDLNGGDEAAAALAVDRSGVVSVVGSAGNDMLAAMFDHQGLSVGAGIFAGPAGGLDYAVDVAVNAYGEAFVAGVSLNAGNNTDYAVFKLTSTVLQSPYPLTATQLYTQTQLTWADNSLDETGFRVERKVGACDAGGGWAPVGETAANAVGFLAEGLNPGSDYCFRVQSFNGSGETSRWSEVDVVTAAPVPPNNLVATALNTTDLRLTWNDNTDGETGFSLQRCTGAGCDFTVHDSLPVAANAVSYVDTSACPGQTYRYRIDAYKTGQWVSAFSAATGDVVTATVQAPSALETDWVSEAWIELKWTDNSTDESEFRIVRCAGSGCGDFAALGSLVSPAGNVLRMRMDEALWNGTVNEVVDRSGAGNHGRSYNGATTTTSGKYGSAGTFDGTNDYVATALTLDQSATSPGATLAAWVYPASTSANNHFVIGTDNGGNDWSLLRNAGTWWVANGVDAALVNTGVAVTVNSWQHLVVTFNPAGGVTLYKDGVSVWSNAAIALDTGTAAVHIGRRGSLNQEFFDGRLDEVAVFTRPISGAEAQVLYDHGLGRYNDRTVTPGTTYRYQVRAHKGASCNWTSDPSAPIERTITPPAPSGLSAVVVDSGRIRLAWTDNTSTETGFRVERCAGSGCGDFAEVTVTAANAVGYFDSGLCAYPGNTSPYSSRVSAVKGTDWSSAPSAPATAVIPALAPPASLSVTSASEDRVSLAWTHTSTDLTGFKLARCDGDAAFCADTGNFGAPVDISPEPAGNLMMLHMDEASWTGAANEIVDASGNGKHGTALGGAAGGAPGNYILGGSFDGSNDYITTTLNIDQGGTAAVTFEAWVYPTLNSNSYKYVFSTENGGADWGLSMYGSTWYVSNGSNALSTSQTVLFNVWQHMMVSFEPGVGVKLYRNGALIWSNATISYDASDANVTLGRMGSSNVYYYTGLMDEVAVYNRALSLAEITARYNRQYSYTQTGLTSGSPYRYRLRAVKSGGCAWESNPAQVDTATVAPPPPTGLSVVAGQTTRIDLAWTDNATSETGYRIEHCPGEDTACDENHEFSLLTNLPVNSTAYSDLTVCENSTHTYRVRAEKDNGPVWQSAWATGKVTTPAAGSTTTFDAVGMSESEIGLAWDDGTFDEDRFIVERCLGSGVDCDEDGEFTTQVVIKPGTVAGNQLHYRMNEILWNGTAGEVKDASGNARHGQALSGAVTTIDGKYYRAGSFDGVNDYILTPLNINQTATGPGATIEAWVYPTVNSTTYKYLFGTENGGSDWGLAVYGTSWYVSNGSSVVNTSQTVTFNAWQHIAISFEPGVGLKLYRNGVLSWSSATIDYDASTANLHIGRLGSSASSFFAGRMDEFAVYNRPLTLAEIQQNYQHQIQIFEQIDTGLLPGTTYTYRLTAERAAVCPWTVTALAEGTTFGPPPPTGLIAMPMHTNRIDLAWSDETGSETAFRVQRCQGAGCNDFADLGALLPANTTSTSDTSVCPGQVYRYQVRAEKSDGPVWTTPWMGPVEVTALTPVAPTAISAVRAAENRIDLSWKDGNPDESGFVVERCAGAGCVDYLPVATLPASEVGSNLIVGANGPVGSFTTHVADVVHPRTKASVKALKLTHAGSTPSSQSATLNLLTDTVYVATFEAWSDEGEAISLLNDLFPDTLPDIPQTVGPTPQYYRALFSSTHANMSSATLRFSHANAGRTIHVTNITFTRLTYPVSYRDVDTGLAPNTPYSYRVKAFKTGACGWDSGYTGSASAVTSLDIPGTLTATAADTTTVRLSWVDNFSTETATLIERCAGGGCDSFSQIAVVGPDVTSYTDASVANGTSYSYRIKAVNQGLSSGGGAVWTRRQPVSFTAFAAYQIYRIVIPYDADMRGDFGDLRFYDETAKKQLPYWIQSKTDGVNATVWFSTRSNNTVNLYYGNPSATDIGRVEDVSDQYTFNGTTIDTGKWVEIDPSGGISQNNALLLNDVTENWTMALISTTTYPRSEGRELYFDLTIAADTPGNNHFMAGWELNQTASPAHSQLVHGLYWNNYAFDVYQKGGSLGVTGRSYAANTRYQMKVVLKAVGARYFVRGGAYADWTLINENATYNDATLRIGIHQYSHQASIHGITVSPGSFATNAALGAEQSSAGYAFDFIWTTGYGNVAAAVTPAKVAPSGLVAVAGSDSGIELTWNDNSNDETGFKIERCTGGGCSNFSQIATVGANVGSYSNTGLSPSTHYRYRVRAYKTAIQSWDSDYSNIAGDLLFPQSSSGLTATALNSRMIRLDWEDNGSDEEGYEIEVQVWNGRFIQTAKVGADVVSYVDRVGIDGQTTYVYRVRPYRGADRSPYSNEASVVTPEFLAGDNTCLP